MKNCHGSYNSVLHSTKQIKQSYTFFKIYHASFQDPILWGAGAASDAPTSQVRVLAMLFRASFYENLSCGSKVEKRGTQTRTLSFQSFTPSPCC
jgi:hypothetical protein